jgi:hypothetical protein
MQLTISVDFCLTHALLSPSVAVVDYCLAFGFDLFRSCSSPRTARIAGLLILNREHGLPACATLNEAIELLYGEFPVSIDVIAAEHRSGFGLFSTGIARLDSAETNCFWLFVHGLVIRQIVQCLTHWSFSGNFTLTGAGVE